MLAMVAHIESKVRGMPANLYWMRAFVAERAVTSCGGDRAHNKEIE